MSNKKVAMVGTPCQILAATKVNRYADYTGGSPIDVKIGLFTSPHLFSYIERFALLLYVEQHCLVTEQNKLLQPI